MMFSESSLVRNIFSKMSEISVIYTVQILPRTDKVCIMVLAFGHIIQSICLSQDSVEVVVFDGDPEKTTAIVMNYFRSRSYTHHPAWAQIRECNLWKQRSEGIL